MSVGIGLKHVLLIGGPAAVTAIACREIHRPGIRYGVRPRAG